ncbi:hypothetical protein Tco_0498706 [Tanacetum coccineum]
MVATSTTEAEYVAAASCCGQVLWIQNQLLDYGYNFMNTMIHIDNNSTICIIENPVQHSKTKHIEIRHHFIRDCNAKKLIQMVKIDTEHNVTDLLTKGFDAGRISTDKQIEYLMLNASPLKYCLRGGRDTKIPQSSGPPIKVGDEVIHKELGDRMERAVTTASSLEVEQDSDAQTRFETTSKQSNDLPLSRVNKLRSGEESQKLIELMAHCTTLSELHNMVAYLEKLEGSEGFHEIIDFLSASHIHYALTASPTIYTSLIEQFWQIAALCTIDDGALGITTTNDRKVKIIVSEASIRRHLKLEDSEGIPSLPTAKIFEQLALMGYVTTSNSITFQKGHFSPQWKFFIHIILHCLSPKKIAWEQFSSNVATAIICLATHKTFNFSKFFFDAMVKNSDSTHKFLMYPRFIQIFLNKHQRLLFTYTRTYPTPSLTHKLFSDMKRISKGYSRMITPLFDTMLVQPQGEEPSIQTTPETSSSKITSSPSLSSHHTSISAPSTS